MGGISLQLKPRDLMKIGVLLNNSGVWNSNRVVSQEWINKIQTSQIDVKELKSGYSNFWWVSNYTEDKIYSAQGYGGQCLMGTSDNLFYFDGIEYFSCKKNKKVIFFVLKIFR